MAFGSFAERNAAHPMAEINTTPLVDVMLVLLVIFIIAAPLFQQAVHIDLPRVDAGKLEHKPLVLQVAIDDAGQLFLDSSPIGQDDLVSRFGLAVHAGPGVPEVHLRADRATRYERLTEVMALAQKAGIQKIAFVTAAPRPAEPSLAALSR